jgi:hypothetical protein
MPDFRCVPIPTEVAERFRRTGIDDRGNPLRRMVAAASGFPCRHCLQTAQEGEPMLLGSYDLPSPQGFYWTPSPIFLHAEACPRFDALNEIGPMVRNSLVSVRSYDAEQMCLYDLGQVVDGPAVEGPLQRALADPRTSFVNLHTAKPGCLLCRVERA